jgi:hypothetical protein
LFSDGGVARARRGETARRVRTERRMGAAGVDNVRRCGGRVDGSSRTAESVRKDSEVAHSANQLRTDE